MIQSVCFFRVFFETCELYPAFVGTSGSSLIRSQQNAMVQAESFDDAYRVFRQNYPEDSFKIAKILPMESTVFIPGNF